MQSKVKFVANYGPIKKNREYIVLKEGYDWYLVKYYGRSCYVPKDLELRDGDVLDSN